jgi:glycerol-3-phosphate dehydrogenase
VSRADVVGIVGAGQFGTALASVLARAGKPVVLWSRDPQVVRSINETRTCPRLPEAPLPPPLEATGDPKRLAGEARFLVMAVSSTDVTERVLHDSYHVATLDNDAPTIFAESADFIRAHSSLDRDAG